MESHVEFEAYVGDELIISKNPERPAQAKKMQATGVKPTPDPVTSEGYLVWYYEDVSKPYALFKVKYLHGDEEGQEHWGFDIGMRSHMSKSLIKRRHSTTCMTHTRNLVIPPILDKWHPMGFKKIKVELIVFFFSCSDCMLVSFGTLYVQDVVCFVLCTL